MIFKYPCKALPAIIVLVILLRCNYLFAQAPNISYLTPQHYTSGTTITPLSPTNKGGSVPANTYGLVSTFAGNGKNGSANGQGPGESFKMPVGITVDKSGNFYVSDQDNSSILKVDPGGTVTTLALHFTTPPTQFAPYGIAVDGGGNLYTADPFSNVIWKIDPSGNVTVLAGGTQGSADGQGAAASFNHPAGIAVDNAGNIYVADTDNQSIRKITPAGVVTTFATGLSYPVGMVINAQGTIYVVNNDNNQIVTVSQSGTISVLAGGTAAGFDGPQFITMDQLGNLYVTDSPNNLIKKVTPAGVVTIIAGNATAGANGGVGTAASFNNPIGIAINAAGDLYVVDTNNNLVRQILLSGYTIDKPLPPGLTFDPNTGTISGTPTSSYPSTDYTITAYNAGGGSSFIINITVGNASVTLAAPNISYPTPNNYTAGTAITPLVPANTGGAVPQSVYGVSTFEGNTGTAATFLNLVGIRSDGSGNIYTTDGSQRVLKITPGGVVTTIAGKDNVAGFANGQGTAALFNTPQQITTDASGNIYIADVINNVIRKITVAGAVTTYAGSGGIGALDGPAATATFSHPSGVVFDSAGNLYVADFNNNEIRKITPGGIVSTLAGAAGSGGNANGSGAAARFSGPSYLAVDASDNIYVADRDNNMIRKITPAGLVSTFAGSGSASFANGTGTAASFSGPHGMGVDAGGNVYVADEGNNMIRKITPAGVVTTLTGSIKGLVNGNLLTARFSAPVDVTIDALGNIFVADEGNNEIRQINAAGYTIDTPLPPGLTFDPTTGTISGTPAAASPATNYTITAYNISGTSSFTISITVTGATIILHPPIIDYPTPQLYTINNAITPLIPVNSGGPVPASIYGQISTFAGSGAAGKADGTGLSASFSGPAGVAFDAAGNLYVGDSFNSLLRKITPAGVVSTVAGYSGNAFGVAIDATGNIYIADAANNKIEKINTAGVVSVLAGSATPGNVNGTGAAASFNMPAGVAVDGAGNVYVADLNNNLIRKITPAGAVTTFAGSGAQAEADGTGTTASFNNPRGIAIDINGNLYVVDSKGNTVRKITSAGVVTTIAGNGAAGAANGTGTQASFNGPEGIAVNAAGYLYIADTGNNMVREISPSGVVITIAANFPGAGSNNSNLSQPTGIAVDAAGNAYFSEFKTNIISQLILSGYTIDKPLPAGLTFDPKTGTISGTPTVVSPATNYTVTAYNMDGSGSFIINITVQDVTPQTITFNPLIEKTYGDPDFAPGATSTNNTLPIGYTSDNVNVATIVNGEIHITGAGNTNITASQPGDEQYADAKPVTQQLIVDRAPLLIIAQDATKLSGQPNPAFIPKYVGFVYNDNASSLTELPVLSSPATADSAPGEYPIIVTGGSSPNYVITPQNGTLTVLPGEAAIVIPNLFTPNGDGINDYWNIKALAYFPQCMVSVFSRNGNLVFQSHGYPKPWDGTYKGSPLPGGTYYYVISPQNDLPKLSGYVVILR